VPIRACECGEQWEDAATFRARSDALAERIRREMQEQDNPFDVSKGRDRQ